MQKAFSDKTTRSLNSTKKRKKIKKVEMALVKELHSVETSYGNIRNNEPLPLFHTDQDLDEGGYRVMETRMVRRALDRLRGSISVTSL